MTGTQFDVEVEGSSGLSDHDFVAIREIARRIAVSLGRVLNGAPEAIELAVTTLFARGHLLIEDVPGVGKTTLATALAKSIDASMTRIQFTSDMLPTDVTGLSIYDQDHHAFRFHPGPIFANVVVGDEVNRATPRTQSALLEAMAEGAVTIDGHTHHLPQPFIVLATQNPGDMEGTFALPEAQRDRFMTRISLGYPAAQAEVSMLTARGSVDPLSLVTAAAGVDEVLAAQHLVSRVHLSEAVARYAVDIVSATRTHPSVSLGASPRATLHLTQMARARAAFRGQQFVSPDDVANLAATVLPHRLAMRGHFASIREAHTAAVDTVSEIVASCSSR
jgi:MoxR-like ATPase